MANANASVQGVWAKAAGLVAALCALAAACQSSEEPDAQVSWECVIDEGSNPPFTETIGCESDFSALASMPLDSSIPGAQSAKTVIDTLDDNKLYFQNSNEYQIHWEFAREHLSGNGKPIVPDLSGFNQTEYYSPSRRFLLGALTYYEGPGVWTYEIAPYDTSSADMIEEAYRTIADAIYVGSELHFHPNSEAVEDEAEKLPSSVKLITTDQLYEGIEYQPLNFGTSVGTLRFLSADELETEFVGFRDIVVLDQVPNDISVVMGIITAEFQTPLSHINVLSQNRGTPNMALRGATDDPALRALQDKWVRLEVGPFEYTVEEVSDEEAEAWWEDNRPDAVQVPNLDLTVTGIVDIEDVLDWDLDLDDALDLAIPAFGGKASHYSALHDIGGPVPTPKACAVPVSYYWQFMEQNGFHDWVAEMLDDTDFRNDAATRELRLQELRDAMTEAPVDPDFLALVEEKLQEDYPGIPMRFRSSTNAEDLDGFTGAGLYISWTAKVGDPKRPVADALRQVWASVWFFRAFEERSYRSIDHQTVGMALLVHRAFPDEEANGVALTANPFDTAGLEPGFYINVQRGEESVVKPKPGATTDQFIYHFESPGQPIVFVAHSNLIPEGTTVLTNAQAYKLGSALKAIHDHFRPIYGMDPSKWYAMDVEFKFEGTPDEEPALFVKQARPHSGMGE